MTDVLPESKEVAGENGDQLAVSPEGGLARLAAAAETLVAAVADDAPRLADKAQAVLERLQVGTFEVVVAGEFNRGKSTLVNALVEKAILPAGALPVTAIATQVTQGDESATVHYRNGSEEIIDLTELEKYVTEEANPGNKLNIDNVTISVPAPVLKHGAVLVDTPGVNSIFRTSSEAALKSLIEADGAVVVLSADAPMTDTERSLLRLVSRRSARTFFVLNRIDHLDADELERVEWFVDNVLQEIFGESQEVFPLSAKTGDGVDRFVSAFQVFLEEGLEDARIRLASYDLVALANRIEDECAIEESARQMTASQLSERIAGFQEAVEAAREAVADDHVLFSNAISRIVTEMEDRLSTLNQVDDPSLRERLEKGVEEVPTSAMTEKLGKLVEHEVKEVFEPVRTVEEDEVARGWTAAARRYEKATHRRIERFRQLAGELFQVKLHSSPVPRPEEREARFFYSAPVDVEIGNGPFSRLLRILEGDARTRSRLLDAAEERIREERLSHSQRLRDDLRTRLEETAAALAEDLKDTVESAIAAMAAAIDRANEAKASADKETESYAVVAGRLRSATRKAKRAVEEAASPSQAASSA